MADVPLARRPRTELFVCREFADVLARAVDRGVVAIAVDIPLGLPESGRRSADAEARTLLGPRSASLFPTPPRSAISALDHAEACARSRTATGRGVSIQCFNLFPKIRAAREALRGFTEISVREAHPETSFAVLSGVPLASKRSVEGRRQRTGLLEPHYPDLDRVLAQIPAGAGADDALDALAAAWTARRLTRGEATTLGSGVDADGFSLTMVV